MRMYVYTCSPVYQFVLHIADYTWADFLTFKGLRLGPFVGIDKISFFSVAL